MRGVGFLLVALAAALAGEEELPEAIEKGLEGPPAARALAARKLARHDGEAAKKALVRLLDDDLAIVRQEAAVSLARRFPDRAPVFYLRDALDAEDWWLRWRAALALGKIGKRASLAIPQLITALRDVAPEVSGAAARALAKLAPRDYRVVNGAVDALTDDKAKRDLPALLALLRAADVPLPERAQTWLGRAAVSGKATKRRAVRAFLLDTADPKLRNWFRTVYGTNTEARVEALRGCPKAVFRPYVVPLIQDPDVGDTALLVIAWNPDLSEGLLPVVIPHLYSGDEETMAAARLAVERLGGKILLKYLTNAGLVVPKAGTPDRVELLRVLGDRRVREAVAKLVGSRPDSLLEKLAR